MHFEDLGLSENVAAARQPQLIRLNLRGTIFAIPDNCAESQPASRLAKALHNALLPRPLMDESGALYFNRNPTVFHDVLDVLTNDAAQFPLVEECHKRLLDQELQFWGIRHKRNRDSAGNPEEIPRPHYGDLEIRAPLRERASAVTEQQPALFQNPAYLQHAQQESINRMGIGYPQP